MINKKNIIILTSVIVIMIVAIFYVLSIEENNNNNNVSDDIVNQQTVNVFNEDINALLKVSVRTPESSYEIYKDNDGKWSLSGFDSDKINYTKLLTLMNSLSIVDAKSIVEQNANDLSKYGIDNSQYVITAYFGDRTYKMVFGDMTTAADSYYMNIDGTKTVYTMLADTFDCYFASKESYRKLPVVDIKTDKISGIRIIKHDVDIKLGLMDNPITINGTNYATWEMTSPLYHTIDNSRLSSYIMDVLPYISILGAVSDNKDYSKYGLDNPYATVIITNTDNTKRVLRISPYEHDKYYVLIDDDTTVYYADKLALSFVDVVPFDLVNKFINIFSFDDFSEVTVRSDSNYKCYIDRNGNDIKCYVNDKQMDESDFNVNVFQNIISLLASDFCINAEYKQPDIFIEYKLKDGSSSKVEFVDYDDRNYAVFKDEKCDFLILKKDVNNLINKLKDIAN